MKQYTEYLVPMDEFVNVIDHLSPSKFKKAIREYKQFLASKPVRTDLLNFDNEGFYLPDNKVMFKGFITCDEASSEDNKVALKDNTYILFLKDEKRDVVIQNDNFITDECTYNEIAIAFNKKNGLNPLEFA